MSDRSASRPILGVDDAQLPRSRRLDHIAIQLEAVLQSLDLENEPHLAEEISTAIRAIERACEIESGSEDFTTDAGGFVFPLQ